MKRSFLTLLLCAVSQLYSQTTTTSDGDFQTVGNWDFGVPAGADDATINHTMILSDHLFMNKGDWTINGNIEDVTEGSSYTLTVKGNGGNHGVLTVDGNLTVEGILTLSSFGEIFIRNGDTLTVGGPSTIANNSVLTIDAGGVLIVNGDVTNNNNAALIINGKLVITGQYNGSVGSSLSGSGTMEAGSIDATGSGAVFGISGNDADCTGGCGASNDGIGNVYYVMISGDDANSGLNTSEAKATIQDVFDDYDLGTGSRIIVGSGIFSEYDIYPGTDDEGFILEGQGITQTILNGDDKGRVLDFSRANHDSITVKKLTISGGNESFIDGGGVRTGSNIQTELVFREVKFDDNTTANAYDGGAFYVGAKTSILFDTCIFSNNIAGKGGAIYIESNTVGVANVEINNCTFSSNEGTNDSYGGGAIYQGYKSSLIIDSCTFTGNHSDASISIGYYGGGVLFVNSDRDSTNTIIVNTKFFRNYANGTNSGGGVVVFSDSSNATINNCSFTENYTTSNSGFGGVIYMDKESDVNISNCIFRGNQSGRGGVIYCDADSLVLSHSTFDLDSASYSGTSNSGLAGGVIYINSGTAIIDSSVFDSCITSAISNLTADGGIIAIYDGNLEVTRSVFSNAFSNDNGGAVSASGGTLDFTNCLFYSNVTKDRGGAVYFGGSGSLFNCTVYGNSSEDNTVTGADGIETWTGKTVTVTNSIIYGNDDHDIREGSGANGTIDVSYSCYSTYSGGGTLSNNISSDPGFFDAGSNDFRILYSSPCRNTGTATGAPSVDILNNSRPFDVFCDMGAYENNCVSTTSWDGNRSSDITDADNWSDGVPCGAGVVIADRGNTPTISNNSLFTQDLTIDVGATLSITSSDPDVYLLVAGDITVNGTISHTGITPIRLTGSSNDINVGGSAIQSNSKYDIKNGASYTLKNTINLRDMTVENGGTLSIDASATLDIDDDFVNNGTLTLAASSSIDFVDFFNTGTFNAGASSTIDVVGDYTNSGTFNPSTSTVSLKGTSLQTLSTGFYLTGLVPSNEFYNLTLNNANGFTLSGDLGVSNTLLMTSGVLTTNSTDTVVIANTGAESVMGYSSASFINGNLIRWTANNTSTYVFPLGKGTSTADYFQLDLENNNMVDVDLIRAKFEEGVPPSYNQAAFEAASLQVPSSPGVTGFTLDELSRDGYFQLDPDEQPSAGSYDLKLYTDNYTRANWQTNKMVIVKRPTGSIDPADWTIAGDLLDDGELGRSPNDGYLIINNINSFSEIIPGGDFGVPLPVELLMFEGVFLERENVVQLNWITATEENNSHFEIERLNTNYEFEMIGEVEGNGNSFVELNYSYIDDSPKEGANYYRLKQVDFSSGFEYSDPIIIHSKIENSMLHCFYYDGTFVISYEGSLDRISIFDQLGYLMDENQLSLTIENNQLLIQNLTDSHQIYFYKIEYGNKIETGKFFL